MKILECDWITKSYGGSKVALKDIKFSVNKGEKVGLVGPIGSGKTTLLRLISGILDSTQGNLKMAVEENKIHYMPVLGGLVPDLNVRDNIEIWRVAYNESKENVECIVEKLGLEKFLLKKVKQLSSGMKTIVSFVCTILGNPQLVLLDEPFVHLDIENCLKIIDIIQEYLCDSTIIVSSHNLEYVDKIVDTFLFIKDGKQLYYSPANEMRREYGSDWFKITIDGNIKPKTKVNLKQQYKVNVVEPSDVYFYRPNISLEKAKKLLEKENLKIKQVCDPCVELKDIYLNIMNERY